MDTNWLAVYISFLPKMQDLGEKSSGGFLAVLLGGLGGRGKGCGESGDLFLIFGGGGGRGQGWRRWWGRRGRRKGAGGGGRKLGVICGVLGQLD